jgi:hypothetical protein
MLAAVDASARCEDGVWRGRGAGCDQVWQKHAAGMRPSAISGLEALSIDDTKSRGSSELPSRRSEWSPHVGGGL